MASEGRAYASGENFEFLLHPRGLLACRVWKRPDLDAETGAALAHAMAAVWQRAGADPAVTSGIFDLSEAPPVFGPRTEEAFRTMLTRIGGMRIALLSGDNAVQRLQLQRIVVGHPHAAVVDTQEAARAHCAAPASFASIAPATRR